MMRKITAGTQ